MSKINGSALLQLCRLHLLTIKHEIFLYRRRPRTLRKDQLHVQSKRLTRKSKKRNPPPKKPSEPWDMYKAIMQYGISTVGIAASYFHPFFLIPTSMWVYLTQINETGYTRALLQDKYNRKVSKYAEAATTFMIVPAVFFIFYRQYQQALFLLLFTSQIYSVGMLHYQYHELKNNLDDMMNKAMARGIIFTFALSLYCIIDQNNTNANQDSKAIQLNK